MTSTHPDGALAQVPLFGELTPAELRALTVALRTRQCARGEVVFLEGDPGDSLYVIEEGRVKIALSSPQGKEVVLTMLGPRDFFGDLALLDGEPRSADAIAVEPSRLLLLRRDDFSRFLGEHPEAAKRLLALLSRRLRRNAALIQDAAFLDIPGRLARTIARLADEDGRADGSSVVIGSRLTQTDLAGLIGATRESVNKWLRTFEREGLLRTERGRLIVRDLERLRAYVDPDS
jgi:CRP-like cAMP-binding protein